MLDFYVDFGVLSIIFAALVAVIVVCLCIGIAYFVLRRAVRRGIDTSETAKLYRAMAEEQLREKYKEED